MGDVPFQVDLLMHSYLMHAILSLIWTVTSISLMIYATQHSRRSVWFAGFSLLAIVGVKLMMIDLATCTLYLVPCTLYLERCGPPR